MDKQVVIVGINQSNYGCTGNIELGILDVARKNNYKTYSVCCVDSKTVQKTLDNQIYIGSKISRHFHAIMSLYTGFQDAFSVKSTKDLIRKLEKIKPSLLHLHIMHGSFINLGLLVDYINRYNIKVIWTMHDCWAITGKCAYFDSIGCEKWKTECGNCKQLSKYPPSKIDRTKHDFNKKKKLLLSIKDLTIVTPSKWLASLIKQSFLKDKDIKVIYNGIDFSIFHPIKNRFKEQNNLSDKFMILGVANGWEQRKGIDYFIEISKVLHDNYKIVLVGLTEEQKNNLPNNIIGITKTSNQNELVEIYSAADVFVNPTLEDNFPTTNIEALACGTPVITFKTGGSPEAIDESCGIVVEQGNQKELIQAIKKLKNNNFSMEACLNRAKMFEYNSKYEEYVKLYDDILKRGNKKL